MYCFEIRDIKNKLKQAPSEHIAEFLKRKLPPELLQELMMIESDSNYKNTSYDEYLVKEMPWKASEMKNLTFMSAEHNDYLPVDLLPCGLPKGIRKYKDSIYFMFVPNGSVEVRFKLPTYTNEYYYCENSEWKVRENITVIYRQQVLIGYALIEGDFYFFLRGYGNKEFNRYTISVYCPDKNALWGAPHYREILTMYKEIITRPNIPIFKKNLEKVISGFHPRTIEYENLYSYIGLLNNEDVECKYQIFLYFIFYLTVAEDCGMYSREYAKVGFKAIEQGKTVEEAIEEQKEFGKNTYIALEDKEINELIAEYKWSYEIIDDCDSAMSGIITRLQHKEESDLKTLYSRMYYKFRRNWTDREYKQVLEYDDMISEIRDMFYELLFDKDGKLKI